MAEKDVEDMKRRMHTLGENVHSKTFLDRMKLIIILEYDMGKFYNVPEVFEDDEFKKSLKERYLISTQKMQTFPKGLFDLTNEKELQIVLENIKQKIKAGICMNLDDFFEEDISDEAKKQVELLKEQNFQNYDKNIINPSDEPNQDFLKTIVRLDKEFFSRICEYSDEDAMELLDEYLFQGKLAKGRNIDYINKSRNEMQELFEAQTIREGDLENLLENQDAFEKRRELLLKVLDLLNETGCLEELVSLENINIEQINEFLSDDGKIPRIDIRRVYQMINELDFTKKSDVIKLIAYNRHFCNKLAHNYEDNVCTVFYIGALNEIEFSKKRDSEIEAFDNEILKLLDNDFSMQENIELLRNAIVRYNLKKGNSSFNKVLNHYINLVKVRKKQMAREQIMTALNECSEPNIRKYQTAKEYSIDCYKKLYQFRKKYLQLLREKYSFEAGRKTSFPELLNCIMANPDDLPQDINELHTPDGLPNIFDEIRMFIQQIKSDGILIDPENILKYATENLEISQIAFDIKEEDTLQLVDTVEKGEKSIHIESQDSIGNEDSVVDIYINSQIQIFGGHYKEYGQMAKDIRVQELLGVPPIIRNGFREPSEEQMTLNLYIPIGDCERQKEEFKSLLETIKYIDGKITRDSINPSELPMYAKIKALSSENYNILKTRILLGSGINEYRLYTENIGLSEKKNRRITIQEFHDQKTDKYFEEELIRIHGISKYASLIGLYGEGESTKRRMQRSTQSRNVDEKS